MISLTRLVNKGHIYAFINKLFHAWTETFLFVLYHHTNTTTPTTTTTTTTTATAMMIVVVLLLSLVFVVDGQPGMVVEALTFTGVNVVSHGGDAHEHVTLRENDPLTSVPNASTCRSGVWRRGGQV